MLKIEGDTIKFSSGREAYANCGIVGISPELAISEGYDGHIGWPTPEWWDEESRQARLSSDDMRELADHMMILWAKFKAELPK